MDKAALLRPHLAEQDVEIPGGGIVRVRALSRAEVFRFQGVTDAGLLDSGMLAAAMVDPVLTPEEVDQWRASAPNGEIDVVTDAILALSGLREGMPAPTSNTFRPGQGEAL